MRARLVPASPRSQGDSGASGAILNFSSGGSVSTAPEVNLVAVVGCGLMGSGIAQVCAEAGHSVIVREVDDAALAAGRRRIESFLQKGVERGKMAEDRMKAVLGAIRGTTDLRDL